MIAVHHNLELLIDLVVLCFCSWCQGGIGLHVTVRVTNVRAAWLATFTLFLVQGLKVDKRVLVQAFSVFNCLKGVFARLPEIEEDPLTLILLCIRMFVILCLAKIAIFQERLMLLIKAWPWGHDL